MGPQTSSPDPSSLSTDWRQTDREGYLPAVNGKEHHSFDYRNSSKQAGDTHYNARICGPADTGCIGTSMSQYKNMSPADRAVEPYRRPSSVTHISQKRKESRTLTRASMMAVTHAWNRRSTSPVNSESFHITKIAIRPEDSVSVVYGGNAMKQDTADINPTAREGMTESSGIDWQRNLSKRFATAKGFSNYIISWNSRMPMDVPVPNFKSNGECFHWQCAVDVASGELLDPVPFPETLRDRSPLQDDKARMRRGTGTANSACKEFTILHGHQKEEKTGHEDSTSIEREDASKTKVDTSVGHEGLPSEKINSTSTEPATGAQQEQTALSNTGSMSPASPAMLKNMAIIAFKPTSPLHSASCSPGLAYPQAAEYYIRPAEDRDMVGVRQIYNFEVLKGTQATDAEPLGVEDFFSVLRTCRKAMLPFLVAVAGQDIIKGTPEDVLGFGFLSVYQPGLAGGLNGTSRYSVKVNVFVHASHRQKGVGSTILNKLLQLCSSKYRPVKDYNARYVHSDGTGLYSSCSQSPRQYHQVFAEVLYGSELGIAEMWYGRILASNFGFQPLGKSIMGAHWSNVGQCWLGKLVFQHDCYAENEFTGDVNVTTRNGAAASRDTTANIEVRGRAREEEDEDGMPPGQSVGASEPVSSQVNGGVMLSGNTKESSNTQSQFW